MANIEWSTISAIAALASVGVAAWAIYMAVKFQSEIALSEQVANIPDLLMKEYNDRKFDKPLEIPGETNVNDLKKARVYVDKNILSKDDNEIENFFQKTKKIGEWENIFAYSISLGLQRVGLWVLTGALPIKVVLADSAHQIVKDWLYCYVLVKDKIQQEDSDFNPVITPGRNKIFFERRHAEWLVCFTILWLKRKNWSSGKIEEAIATFGELHEVREREREIRTLESDLIPPSTEKILQELICLGDC